jgi:hypothetical protein
MPYFWTDGSLEKLKYLQYIMDSEIYHKGTDGWYICGCGFESLDNDLTHLCSIIKGYCNNGTKAIADNKYKCICGKILDNPINGKRHCHGGICVEKAKELELFSCKICDVECHTKYELARHEKTKRHKNKVDTPLLCKTCNIRCDSKTDYETHLNTNKHKRLLESPNIDLECKLCNIKCLSQTQVLTHLKTKKHLKKMNLVATSQSTV